MRWSALPSVLLAALVVGGAPAAAAAAPLKERPLPATPRIDLTWWRGFGDPQLNLLLAEALAGNPDVKTAAARLGIAEVGIGGARAERRPALNLDARGGVRKYTPTASRQDPDINRPGLELSAGYELDLWGRLSQEMQAATADWIASADDVTSAQLALSAEVAATWFSLRANTTLLEVLAERRDRAQALLTLQQQRLRRVSPLGMKRSTKPSLSGTWIFSAPRWRKPRPVRPPAGRLARIFRAAGETALRPPAREPRRIGAAPRGRHRITRPTTRCARSHPAPARPAGAGRRGAYRHAALAGPPE